MAQILNIFTDGGSRNNPGPAASAFVVFDDQHHQLYSGFRFLNQATNNVAEYTAVILALEWVSTLIPSPTTVNFYLDSQLVVYQLTGKYRIKDSNLLILSQKISVLLKSLSLTQVSFTYIPREQNSAADALVNRTIDAAGF